jgi:callose synthase
LKAGSRTGGRPDELGGVVPPSLGQASNIDIILQAAEEIQPDDPQVARILCEYAYSMAHTLDPQSEGRGVLQFKTGLMSVIRQKQSKKEGERIDRTHDIQRIQEFYELYRAKHQIDELERLQKVPNFEEDPGELERRTQKLKKVYQTSRVLNDVLNALTRDATPEEREKLIQKEVWSFLLKSFEVFIVEGRSNL